MNDEDCMGEIIPGLWIGNLLSASRILDNTMKSHEEESSQKDAKTTILSILSLLSSPKLTRFVKNSLQTTCHASRSVRCRIWSGELVGESVGNFIGKAVGNTRESNDAQIMLKPQNDHENDLAVEVHHAVIPLRDTHDSDLLPILPLALSFIDNALANADAKMKVSKVHQICLVHCARGMSRSVSVVTAYLIKAMISQDCQIRQQQQQQHQQCIIDGQSQTAFLRPMPSIVAESYNDENNDKGTYFYKALTIIRKARPQAMPNIKFVLELRSFEKQSVQQL